MIKLQVIGNLGADARVINTNGNEFVSFRVAHTETFTANGSKQSRTIWVDVAMNGNGGNLLQYLKRGAKVFIDGYPSFRIYDSAVNHCKMVGVQISARSVELCGGSSDAVPSELSTKDGEVLKIQKLFWTGNTNETLTELFDSSMNKYDVDERGLVFPHHEQ